MQANKLPPQRGWQWLGEGFRLWRRNPGLVSSAALASLLLSAMLGSLPVIGSFLACMMAPVMSVTVIRICHLVASSSRLDPAALRLTPERLKGLAVLGVVLYLSILLAEVLSRLIAGDAMTELAEAAKASGQAPAAVPVEMIYGMAVYSVVIAIVGSLMWFAPMLTGLRGTSPFKAMFFTVVACWRNKMTFLVFSLGLIAIVFPLTALMGFGSFGQSLAIMLMVGVLWPIINAVNYLSLMDIFGDLFQPGNER